MRRRDLALWAAAVALVSTGALTLLHRGPASILGPCPLRVWTGIPCPTCFGTGALMSLANGNPAAAIAANPMIALLAVGWVASGIVALLLVPWATRIRLRALPGARWMAALLLVLLAANWVYLLAR